ncbi:hypothetical protein ILUMI_06722 [Ignelater luminosus]|uniref:Uncharacterized protein n=1 Tax=Ignelater luminosus TaxID=2038154 RepID=A0A8K0DA34_IGNLU|nr:hypothetical protein ILUMI_06722 [Ignelater luminosus]
MERKPFKTATRRLRNTRECSHDSRFTLSTIRDEFFDSVYCVSEEQPYLYRDFGKTSKRSEYGDSMSQNVKTERESEETEFPQLWKNGEDLLRIKLEAGRRWPGSVKLHCKCDELLQYDSDPEEDPILKAHNIRNFSKDVSTETRSTTPDSLIWLSFPKNNTTRLLLKVVKKLEMYIEAGLLEECTDSTDPPLDVASFVKDNLQIVQKMQRKPFKSATRGLESVRGCSSSSGFTLSTVSDVFFDSVSRTTDGLSDLYLDWERTSKHGFKVDRNTSLMEDEFFPITKRDLKNAEYDNFILQSLDTGRKSEEVPFPQMWKNSQDLLKIKFRACQQWPGIVEKPRQCEELLKLDVNPEEPAIAKSNIIQTLDNDIVTETRSTTPDSSIWLSFPNNSTTRLLLKVIKKLQLYIDAGLLEERTESLDTPSAAAVNPPPILTKRKTRSLATLFACPRCIIS